MKLIKTVNQMQKVATLAKKAGHKISFVPTMGALHEGHISLVRKAKKLGDITIVSIFVNPTQFGPNEDLSKYPSTFDGDKRKLKEIDVDYLFAPNIDMIYPKGYETYITVEKLSLTLEGEFRPVHFRGVTTVVTKLFNIIQPDIAVFGQKDFQQAVIIKKMVADINYPVKIVVTPIVREKSGLAMSSRNRYFNVEQRERACVLYKSLIQAKKMIADGERSASKIRQSMQRLISETSGTKLEYIAITDNIELMPIRKIQGKFTISLAVWLDEVRLIDNISITLKDKL
jgi:pantoate--beta-alanine ligase